MKTAFPIIPMSCALLAACSPPIHDDPNHANQVTEWNAFWAGSKDDHYAETHNDFIDTLMLAGDSAFGGTLDGLVYSQAPGCAVGVLRNGEITYLQTYGYATEDSDWTFDTISPVASVSKTFTAVGIMKMVEESLIDLDEPIQTYMGNSGAFAGLTVEDVLSMNAGIPAGSPNWSQAPTCPGRMPASATVDWCLSHSRVAFDEIRNDITLGPQSDKYSNISIMVAGAVMDQVSYDSDEVDDDHRGYEAWIWHQLGHWSNNHNVTGELTSLALTHSWRYGDITPYADGFACQGNCGSNPPEAPAWQNAGTYEGWWGPAGGWAMTIGDLARFVSLIDNENVLTEESWDILFDKRNNVFDNSLDYGLGTIVETWDHLTQTEDIVWHGGDLNGYSSIWFYSKLGATSYGVAIQCNGNGGEATGSGLKDYAQAVTDYARAGGNIYPEQDIVLGVATATEADGEYVIGKSSIHQVSPSSIHLPALMPDELILRVDNLGRGILNFRLSEAKAGEQRPITKNHDLGRYRYTANQFSYTTPQDLTLNTKLGPMRFTDVAFDIGFAKQATHITQSRLSAVVDLSELEAVGAIEKWPQLCKVAKAQNGVSCLPCDHGRKACLPVVYEFRAARTKTLGKSY